MQNNIPLFDRVNEYWDCKVIGLGYNYSQVNKNTKYLEKLNLKVAKFSKGDNLDEIYTNFLDQNPALGRNLKNCYAVSLFYANATQLKYLSRNEKNILKNLKLTNYEINSLAAYLVSRF